MRFPRISSKFAAGAAGLITGLVYHKISGKYPYQVSAAKEKNLNIDGIVSKDVEVYVDSLTPMMKYGFPNYDALRIKRSYITSYDRRHRNPNWVMEHLTSDMVNEENARGSRKNSKFMEDESIHNYFRATLDDYRDSGYDRGHLAPAANHKYSQMALDETFILSNITPQNEYFNQGIWNTLETHVRDLAREHGSVYVCSGPLYLPREIHADEEEITQFLERQPSKRKRRRVQGKKGKTFESKKRTKMYVIYEVIGENSVAVPTHFFKVIVIEAGKGIYDMEAYLIPNERASPNEPLSKFMVPREAIERYAGFLLFHKLQLSMFRFINGENNQYISDNEYSSMDYLES